MSYRLERDRSCMTCLRKSTTILYRAYIKFTLLILPRDVLIFFLGAHLILPVTLLTFALGIQGCVENRSRGFTLLWLVVNVLTSMLLISDLSLCHAYLSLVWCGVAKCSVPFSILSTAIQREKGPLSLWRSKHCVAPDCQETPNAAVQHHTLEGLSPWP